jgi:hypothetical protein
MQENYWLLLYVFMKCQIVHMRTHCTVPVMTDTDDFCQTRTHVCSYVGYVLSNSLLPLILCGKTTLMYDLHRWQTWSSGLIPTSRPKHFALHFHHLPSNIQLIKLFVHNTNHSISVQVSYTW